MVVATPNDPGLDAYAVAVNKVTAATGRWVNCSKARDKSKRDDQISHVSMRGISSCSGVTHGDFWGKDEVVEFNDNRPYCRIVQVESEVWPEVGVNRGDHVELG